eukprot:4021314-Pyramimonas_sp.AAC.1
MYINCLNGVYITGVETFKLYHGPRSHDVHTLIHSLLLPHEQPNRHYISHIGQPRAVSFPRAHVRPEPLEINRRRGIGGLLNLGLRHLVGGGDCDRQQSAVGIGFSNLPHPGLRIA